MPDFTNVSGERIADACVRRRLGLASPGFCLSCGVEVAGVQPEAVRLKCEACGSDTMFGCEGLLADLDLEVHLSKLP
jgi:hypothetical protein